MSGTIRTSWLRGGLAAALAVSLLGGPLLDEGAGALVAPARTLDAVADGSGAHLLAPGAPLPDAADQIGPGSSLFIRRQGQGAGCTANFVWTDGAKHYLGTAGHCLIKDFFHSTHGPDADWNPADTSVWVCVQHCHDSTGLLEVLAPLGPVSYARRPPTDTFGPDFGIVEIPANLMPLVDPSMPVWGGPQGVETRPALKPLCHYGHGVAVGTTFPTKARAGVGLGGNSDQFAGWMAAAPGDSGSAVVACEAGPDGLTGKGAVGILTTISAGGSGVTILGTTISKAIRMATEANLSISLVEGA